MFENGKIAEKDSDDPDPKYLTHFGELGLRSDSTTADEINSSLRVDEEKLGSVIDRPGDPVLHYIEANGKWVAYNRETYTDRAGIGLPKKAREALELDPEDTVEVWLDEWEEPEKGRSDDQGEGRSEPRQQALSDRQIAEDEYVWILENKPGTTYHHIRHDDGAVTVCGINFGDKEYRTLSDPGDALDECEECDLRSAGDMTNRELVEWLANESRGDFDVGGDGAPAYLSKTQLMALRHYIIDLETELNELKKEPTVEKVPEEPDDK